MRNSALTLSLILSASLTTLPAIADEVWTAEGMEIFYEADLDNGMAVLNVDGEGKMFIQGLAGVYEDRGDYDGIWIANDDSGDCDVGIANPQTGEVSYSWGRLHMIFVDSDFPGRWVALGGECMEDPNDDPIIASPLVAKPFYSDPDRMVED